MLTKIKPTGKPTSEKQIAANRRNALRYTGPASPAGRAVSSQNAKKYQLLAHESPEFPARLTAQYYADFLPANKSERRLVDIMVFSERILLNCALLESLRTGNSGRRKAHVPANVRHEADRLRTELPQIRDSALCAYENALTQFEAIAATPPKLHTKQNTQLKK